MVNYQNDPEELNWLASLAEEEKSVVVQKSLEQKFERMRNERRESYIKVDDLQQPDLDLEKNRKIAEKFTTVDDMLMEVFEKQIWQDDIAKAPNMWERSDEVPQFVRSHLKRTLERSDVLYGNFADLPHTAALKVQEIIQDQLTDPNGWSIETVTKALADEFEALNLEDAEDIARTEVAAVLNKAREIAYEVQEAARRENEEQDITGLPGEDQRPGEDEGVMYYWAGPEDEATTNICSETKDEIESRGGFVEKDELKEILRGKAKEYKEVDGGLPNRVESFVPHYQCRHTFIREDYQRVT